MPFPGEALPGEGSLEGVTPGLGALRSGVRGRASLEVAARPGVGLAAADAHLGLLVWCLWLLLCWLGLLWRGGLGLAGWGLVALASAGLMLVWPAARLSQGMTRGWGRRWWAGLTLVEWVQLMVVWQAVVWPLKWTSGWSLASTAALSGVVAGWSLGAAGFLAWGRGESGGAARTFAAVAAAGLVWAGPLVALLGGPSEAAQLSAVVAATELARGVVSPSDPLVLGGALGAGVFGAATLAWCWATGGGDRGRVG
ncbi:MAG: hypothetical protein AAF288_14030 [Planctomycetota bacterium]